LPSRKPPKEQISTSAPTGFNTDIDRVAVLDIGSGWTKVGFSGEKLPQTVIPTVVGHTRGRPSLFVGSYEDFCIGNEALEKAFQYSLKNPVERGMSISQWDDMEALFFHLLKKKLGVFPEQMPVLLTDAGLSPSPEREKATIIMFETFNVPAFSMAFQGVLSMFSTGQTTGIAIELGHGVNWVTPVYEGSALPHAMIRMVSLFIVLCCCFIFQPVLFKFHFFQDRSGHDLTQHLRQRLLGEAGNGIRVSRENNRAIEAFKETRCYVPLDFDEEMRRIETERQAFILPDSSRIECSSKELVQCPEILFNPRSVGIEEDGIHQLVVKSLLKCPEVRDELSQNIVLGGGSSMFRGLPQRTQKEIRDLLPVAPGGHLKRSTVRVVAPEERRFSAWLGGSIFASTISFEKKAITKAEYDENGPAMVHRKCW
jgi:actin